MQYLGSRLRLFGKMHITLQQSLAVWWWKVRLAEECAMVMLCNMGSMSRKKPKHQIRQKTPLLYLEISWEKRRCVGREAPVSAFAGRGAPNRPG